MEARVPSSSARPPSDLGRWTPLPAAHPHPHEMLTRPMNGFPNGKTLKREYMQIAGSHKNRFISSRWLLINVYSWSCCFASCTEPKLLRKELLHCPSVTDMHTCMFYTLKMLQATKFILSDRCRRKELLNYKNNSERAGEMALCSHGRSSLLLGTYIWQLIIACNSSSRGSVAHFGLLWTPASKWLAHTCV